jgi:cytochrome P450
MVALLGVAGEELHASLRAAAAEAPIAIEESSGATVVLRHRDVENLARDHRLAGVGLAFFDLMGINEGTLRDWYGSLMFTNDGPGHDRLRSLVSRAFTPRAVEALRADAAALAASSVAPLIDDGGDAVDALALLAMRVMCRLLGVPDEDVAVFGAWADALSPIFGLMDADQIRAASAAVDGMLGYVDDLVTRRRADAADDLITALLAAEDAGDKLTHDELVAMVANLLVGGHDTTTSQIGCSLLTVLRHPDEAARLRAQPELLGSAVAETIRYEPSIVGVPRTAVESLSVAGTELPAGSLLLLCTGAANREPGVWDEPDRFDAGRFARPDAPRLLSFGAGPHYCLGAALARLTTEEAVRAPVLDAPDLELAEDPAALPWRVVLGRSPARLPVATR